MGEPSELSEKTEELLRQSRELLRSLGERLAGEEGSVVDEPEDAD